MILAKPNYKIFPDSEFRQRLARAKEEMAERALDALFITDGLNFFYFTGGSPPFSNARPHIALLPKDGEPLLVVPEVSKEALRLESWISTLKSHLTFGAPIEMLKEMFRELGVESGRIGCELGKEQRLGISLSDFDRLKASLPDAQFVDASALLWNLRIVKSKAEVECVREACNITTKALNAAFEKARVGMRERQLANFFCNEVSKNGGFAPFTFVNSGPYNYNYLLGPAGFPSRISDQKLSRGNMLYIDAGCTYNGYWCDFCRMASIGKPSKEQISMHELIDNVTQECVDMVKPGIKISEIAEFCAEQMERAGYPLKGQAGRMGHGVGLMVTEPPNVSFDDVTVLKPGMTFTIEPMIVMKYGCFATEQDLVVTEAGCEVLSKAPTEMQRI